MTTYRTRTGPAKYTLSGWHYRIPRRQTWKQNLIGPDGSVRTFSNWMSDAYEDHRPYPDHNLVSMTRTSEPCRANGYYYRAFDGGYYHLNSAVIPLDNHYTIGTSDAEPNWTFYETKALVQMNPYTPSVDLPLFISELTELPNLIRQLGTLQAAIDRGTVLPELNIGWSFGWDPLRSDLAKLIDFAASWEASQRALKKSRKVEGLLKTNKYTLPAGTVWCPWRPIYRYVNFVNQIEERAWFSADYKFKGNRWKQYGIREFYGIDRSASSIWERLPWSWLIDYFANIGDVLASSRGLHTWEATNMNLMHQRTTKFRMSKDYEDYSGVKLVTGHSTLVSKRRKVISIPFGKLSLTPMLNHKQINILSSLAIIKLLGGNIPIR